VLTKTTVSAIRALIYLGSRGETMLPPKSIADAIGESPSYLAKVLRQLVKVGILRAAKGRKGGVWLGRGPSQITLLSIAEACQGIFVGNYCAGDCDPKMACAYHEATAELQSAVVRVLSRWKLSHLIARPQPRMSGLLASACLLNPPGARMTGPGRRKR